MTIKELAERAGVSMQTISRMKKKPGWPGMDDPESAVAFVKANKGNAGRKGKKFETEAANSNSKYTEETNRLAIEYKRSQIEKNNTATREYQLRILKEYRGKMVKGCSESMTIIFKAIKALDLDHDQIRAIKEAAIEAREHLKGIIEHE